MSTIINHLPDYQPNQLLTDESLNATSNFLEQQELFTRFGFTKTGIIDGLNYEVDIVNDINGSKINAITIHSGFGGSIDGYFINHQYPDGEVRYTQYKSYEFSNDIAAKNLNILRQKPFENDTKDVKINSASIKAYELLPEKYDKKAKEKVNPLIQAPALQNATLVLFLEIIATDEQHCSTATCDEGGKMKHYRVVPLLIENSNDQIFTKINEWHKQRNYVRIKRYSNIRFLVGDIPIGEKMNDLEAATTLTLEVDRLNANNKRYLTEVLGHIKDYKLPQSFPQITNTANDIATFFERHNLSFSHKQDFPFNYGQLANWPYDIRFQTEAFQKKIKEPRSFDPKKLSDDRVFPYQVYFDFCADLELAINEFTEQYNLVCHKYYTSYEGRLRRFLALGTIPMPKTGKDEYRYYATEGFQHNSRREAFLKLKQLYSRIYIMTQVFMTPEEMTKFFAEAKTKLSDNWISGEGNSIRIVPSRSAPSKLGERAIPFYYKREGILDSVWRGGENHIPIKTNINHYSDLSTPYSFLADNINEYNFFRIEGVVGLDISDIGGLWFKHFAFNAPFQIMTISIAKLMDLFFEDWFLINKHAGIEHIGGVYRGGTYIMVTLKDISPENKEKNPVIADFQVPYFMNEPLPDFVKNRLKESKIFRKIKNR